MRRLLLFFILLSFVLACQKQVQRQEQPKEKRVVISLYKVQSEEVPVEYSTKGYFEGEKDVILKPLVSGRVLSLFVDEGSFVKAGQPLLKIDEQDYKNIVSQLSSQIAQAKANLENIKAQAERRKFLFERELIAREEYENYQTQARAQEDLIRSLKAQLENARLNLERTTLTAPFSGYIAQRFVNIGDYITPQSQTFRLVSLDPIRFVFQIPQEYLPYAKEGSTVKIYVEPYGELEGKVFFVSPAADQSRLITIKVRLSNPKGELKPGMYGEARITLRTERAFKVPERAVVLQGNRKVVWRIEGGVAQPVIVDVIRQGEGFVYVKGELKDGDNIALDNAYILQQGMKVEVK